MEQSNSEPINGNTAHDEPGKPNPESPAAKPDENSGETPAFKAMPNELFEKAVNDAQVLLDYVVRRNKTQIDEETLTTLIGAKQRNGTNQTVDAKTEAKFWLSYRKLLQLARPRVHYGQVMTLVAAHVDQYPRTYYSKKLHLFPRRIRITNAKCRWGSCSRDNRLSFSWRLIMAPRTVIDYVLIHELAHIEEKNHSERFWNFLESILPDYRNQRLWLKENGYRLRFCEWSQESP